MADIFQTQFQTHLLYENCSMLFKFRFQDCTQQSTEIGSDKGKALNKGQVIVWTNDDLAYWRIRVSFELTEIIGK